MLVSAQVLQEGSQSNEKAQLTIIIDVTIENFRHFPTEKKRDVPISGKY